MRQRGIITIIVAVVIVAALVCAAATIIPSMMNQNNTTDNNTTTPAGDHHEQSTASSSHHSGHSGPSVVSEDVRENYQAGDGSHYRQVEYSDGNFRQYDTKSGKLIGSSYDSDQKKLPDKS